MANVSLLVRVLPVQPEKHVVMESVTKMPVQWAERPVRQGKSVILQILKNQLVSKIHAALQLVVMDVFVIWGIASTIPVI